jgi:hypothetical protein
LTENKLLSGDAPPDDIPNRVRAFIHQLRLAPVYVLDVEIVDRLHDMMDVAYIEALGNERDKRAKMRQKMTKCKSTVHHITHGRGGFNAHAKSLFDWRMSELEGKYGQVPIVGYERKDE